MQGAAVVGVEDSPGLDVGDGLLDHLADPVDALVRTPNEVESAAVFAPALPGLSMIAAYCPAPSGPWSNQAVRGWYPNPPLNVGAAPSLAEWTSTRVASTSITSGEAALIPAVGECSPARDHTLRLTSPPGRLDRVGVLGQGLDQAADRGVGGHRPEELPLAAQQGQIRQAPAPQGRAQRQVRHDLARVVHRQWPAPGRQGADSPTSRPTARIVPVSSRAPAGPTAGTSPASTPACGYNPVPFTTRVPLP